MADSEIEYVIADGPSPDSWLELDGMAEGWREFTNSKLRGAECPSF